MKSHVVIVGAFVDEPGMADILLRLSRTSSGPLIKVNTSGLHISAVQLSSPFVKAQKKMDPEIAKLREERKRRKLKKEIKLLESFGKKLKPVEEYVFDKKYEENINERIRPTVRLSEDEEDERAALEMVYKRYLNKLAVMDTRWITESIRKQENALQKLKMLSPRLYKAALESDECFLQGFVYQGPTLTPPLESYDPPDGHYIDLMDGRSKQISDVYVINSSKITFSKDKVGTGNFADVYKGTYHRGKEKIPVAVKIVRVGGGNMDTELRCLSELKNEAMIMSLHHHRCIIEFFGISSDKIPMILMEYCAGGSLDLHLQKFKERILTAERITYMYQISDGMRYLERKRCVHRDLATRNMLISNTGCLKISDFGLSFSPAIQLPKLLTKAHIPVRWMAPETLSRTPTYSSKSDIWSFGIVVFEIFSCGGKPWPEKPIKWIATKIRKGVTPEMPRRMPRLIREIASACFQFEPDKRPTFKQVNGWILLVQGIRFPPLPPSTLSVARLENVKPVKFIEKDPEAIAIELDDVKNVGQECDNDKHEPRPIKSLESKGTVPAVNKNTLAEGQENMEASRQQESKLEATESDHDDNECSRSAKKGLKENFNKGPDRNQ
ncbi:unnamed protein product [Litomosoides sigmodontis]|uniref:Large ribosomal subunit protein mL40 n=1 Tax=Litomosoides sigmodontis TaxID=42156 RepID=A0A3P6S823_LITSI|nr:unnamed protein product [Litomosoides sigmodontis]